MTLPHVITLSTGIAKISFAVADTIRYPDQHLHPLVRSGLFAVGLALVVGTVILCSA